MKRKPGGLVVAHHFVDRFERGHSYGDGHRAFGHHYGGADRDYSPFSFVGLCFCIIITAWYSKNENQPD